MDTVLISLGITFGVLLILIVCIAAYHYYRYEVLRKRDIKAREKMLSNQMREIQDDISENQ